MAWRIEFDAGALRDLRRLDRQVARRITLFLRDRIGVLDDPRRLGAPLKHVGASDPAPLWRYRVGAWRIVAHIEDVLAGRGEAGPGSGFVCIEI